MLNVYSEDGFCRFYELRWSNFAKKIAPQILEYYLSKSRNNLNSAGNILDLCCGTGILAEYFLKNGNFNITGVDFSENMLKRAIEKTDLYIRLNRAEFICADIREFNSNKKYDLVVSTFNSLNHLDSIDDLITCFNRVFDVLNNEGYFIFDLNTRKGVSNWYGTLTEDYDDLTSIYTGIYASELNKAYCQLIGFIRNDDGMYTKHNQVISNTIYEIAKVKKALLEIGFRTVEISNINDFNLTVSNPELEEKVCLIACK